MVTIPESFALIPVYEPSEVLPDFARQLQDAGFAVIIVDDGSGEKYKPVFEATRAYAEVLSYPVNHGKGYALKTGLRRIAEKNSENAVVVTLDADGQHLISDALRVRNEALLHKDSLILGSRKLSSNVPLRSRFGNTVTRFVFRLTAGKKVYDTQTGLRAFFAEWVTQMCEIDGDRYEYEMNVLLYCAHQNIPIREIDIKTIYLDNNASSHFHTFSDSALIYREILKFSLSSFAGFLVDYASYSILTVLTSGLDSAVGIPLSNIAARVVSASVNYTLNRRYVFKNKESVIKTASMYFTLAACILAGNTLLLSVLTEEASINKFLAKIITEVIFFFISWSVQKLLIFRRKKHIPQKVKMNESRAG